MVRKSHLQKKTKKAVLKKRNLRSKKSIRKISRKTKGGEKEPIISCHLKYGTSFNSENGGMLNVNGLLDKIKEANKQDLLNKYGAIYIMKEGTVVAYLEGSNTFLLPGNRRSGDALSGEDLQKNYGSDANITLFFGDYFKAQECNKDTL
jgi:hypothetical protein